MKKILIFAISLFIAGFMNAQIKNNIISDRRSKKSSTRFEAVIKPSIDGSNSYNQFLYPRPVDYMKKSKNQKTAAWILTAAGVVMASAALIHDLNNLFSYENSQTGLYIGGLVSVGAGVILFSAAAKNKRKATSTSASIKKEQLPGQRIGVYDHSFPALELRIPL
jgi:hypothetical protein